MIMKQNNQMIKNRILETEGSALYFKREEPAWKLGWDG